MDPQEALRILDEERARGLTMIGEAGSADELEAAKVTVLGRKSRYAQVQRSLGSFPDEERKRLGMAANSFRSDLEAALGERREALSRADQARLTDVERVDVTLPGRRLRPGSLHPLTIVEEEIVGIFTRMGYRLAEGPEIEDDWHNFEALNIPPDHPARTMKDSLYVEVPGMLLRTETSAVQVRTMESQQPPVYIVAPGRTYRREAVDATHLSVFNQVECLAVDEGISFADLKGTLEAFANALFGAGRRIRMNPDYFPFVEPGCQLDIACAICDGRGRTAEGRCPVCEGVGWSELLGAGMIHPNVFRAVGYDPERFTGFAFGMGIERIAMARYGIPEIRLFLENDVRFLHQF